MDRLDFVIDQALRSEDRLQAPASLGPRVLLELEWRRVKRSAPPLERLLGQLAGASIAVLALLGFLGWLEFGAVLQAWASESASWTYARMHVGFNAAPWREIVDPSSILHLTSATLTAAVALVAGAKPLLILSMLGLCALFAALLGLPSGNRMAGTAGRAPRHVFFVVLMLAAFLPERARGVGEPSSRRSRATSVAEDSTRSELRARPEAERPVARRKTAGYDIVKFGERVHVHADEIVRGDLVALGGDVRVEGEVTGNVVVVGGDLDAGGDAQIGGQALALGGRVDTATGAQIEGGVVSLSLLPAHWFRDDAGGRLASAGRILGQLLRFAMLLVVAAVLVAVFPRRIQRATSMMGSSFLRCFGLGVLALSGGLFAVAVVCVLLAITLVGIPLALLLACGTTLLLTGAWIVGVSLIGERLLDARGHRRVAPLAAAATGLFIMLAPPVAFEALRGAIGPVDTTLRLAYAAFVLTILATGLGAVLFSRLGSEGWAHAPGQSMPPLPDRPSPI